MKAKITKRLVNSLEPDPARHFICWDTVQVGFGVKVTKGGTKTYVVRYVARDGRERQFKLARLGELTPDQARQEAAQKRGEAAGGGDPQAEREARRAAPTVEDLYDRFMSEHAPKRAAKTQAGYEQHFRLYLLPAFGPRKVADVSWSDLDQLHRSIEAPYQANRVLATASKAFALARRWGWYPRTMPNPAADHDRHPEKRTGQALDDDQLARLGAALDADSSLAASAIRLTLLSGARPAEIRTARFEDFERDGRVLRLPSSKTGPRRVYLGMAAADLVASLPRLAGSPYLFPGRKKGRCLFDTKAAWGRARKEAELDGLRLYDATRHTYTSKAMALRIPGDRRRVLVGHAPGRDAHEAYLHAEQHPELIASLLLDADRVAGALDRALRGEPGQVLAFARA